MKKLLSLLPALLIFCNANGQIIYPLDSALSVTTFTFASSDSLYKVIPIDWWGDTSVAAIDTNITDSTNVPLWQIGSPTKTFFETEFGSTTGIMTSLSDPYPINANSWFTLKVYNTPANFIVDVYQRYQTDSFHAGGFIEFSLDEGVTWNNILQCSGGFFGIDTAGMYAPSDTLFSGQPAFMGTQPDQQISRFQFFDCVGEKTTAEGCGFFPGDTIFIRFRFQSDSVALAMAGWIIDSISLETVGCTGGVAKVARNNELDVYPNPSYGLYNFPEMNHQDAYQVEVFNSIGERVYENRYVRCLDLGKYPPGLYFYKVTGNGELYTGQLLRN